MSVGEDPPGRRLHHEVHRLDRWHAQRCHACRLADSAVLLLRVIALDALVALRHLPQLYRLVVRRQQEVRLIFAFQPSDFVDFLLDLERLQVVELGLVRLEGAVNVKLASTRVGGF